MADIDVPSGDTLGASSSFFSLTDSTNASQAEECVLKSLRYERRGNFKKALKFAEKGYRMHEKHETQVIIRRVRSKLNRTNASAPNSHEQPPNSHRNSHEPEPEIIPPPGHENAFSNIFSQISEFFQRHWARISPNSRPLVILIYSSIALILLKRVIFPDPTPTINNSRQNQSYQQRRQRESSTNYRQQEQEPYYESYTFDSWSFGGLPGDINIGMGNISFFAPVMSMILLNVVINLLMNFVRR